MSRDIIVLTDVMLITCIVQRGLADVVVKAAREAGAQGATIYHARGVGIQERLGMLGEITIDAEKEIIKIVVSSEQADHVFGQMFLAAKLDTPGMGFIHMSRIEKAATYVPSEIVERLEAEEQQRQETV